MARVLMADDEADIRELVRRYAERDGHEVVCAPDGAQAIELCERERFDVAVLDVMMPEMDGYRACKEITSRWDIPVILLTARGEEYDRLFGFEVGADDYVVKPFSPKELMARIRVVTSRHAPHVSQEPTREVLTFDRLRIDVDGHEVYVDGESVQLTAKEFAVLLCLARRPGTVLTRESLLETVWGYEGVSTDRTVDWQIKLLRSKLGPCRGYIRTVRGVGYKFDAQS